MASLSLALAVLVLGWATVWGVGTPAGHKRGGDRCSHWFAAGDSHATCRSCRIVNGLCDGPTHPCEVYAGWTEVEWAGVTPRCTARDLRIRLVPGLSVPLQAVRQLLPPLTLRAGRATRGQLAGCPACLAVRGGAGSCRCLGDERSHD